MMTADTAAQKIKTDALSFGVQAMPAPVQVNGEGLAYYSVNLSRVAGTNEVDWLGRARIYIDWMLENYPRVVKHHDTRVTVGSFAWPEPEMAPPRLVSLMQKTVKKGCVGLVDRRAWTFVETPLRPFVLGQRVLVGERSPHFFYYYATRYRGTAKRRANYRVDRVVVLRHDEKFMTVSNVGHIWEGIKK